MCQDGQGIASMQNDSSEGTSSGPSPAHGTVTITPPQLAYMSEGIDWRAPQRTWRPQRPADL
jgi:transposase